MKLIQHTFKDQTVAYSTENVEVSSFVKGKPVAVVEVGKDKTNKQINLYIFSWGKNEYANEFGEYKNIKIKDIPEPLIDVYKEISRL